ncbi:MAG: geranylgeranylglyceryl/heptaprenylglyceryl phosphate synthase [Flavobacteriales bacterium]|jgi:phosphoglycerol geranylgeranyltransferase|nr:geranylgeranylglyceryl/heptaprenylglyceryl phosphate synthase [Flavobacteriales bacterium]
MSIYQHITSSKKNNSKLFAILIDPDKQDNNQLTEIIKKANDAKVDLFFVGGSLLIDDRLDQCIKTIKENSEIPLLLFPGNAMQVSNKADGILFLSLISGRNPHMLIGQQVISAPILKKTTLEIISTGYMLVDSGEATAVSYMSNTTPIPYSKDNIAAATAIAGEMLGLKILFLDGGSGAKKAISTKMIKAVSNQINIPLITGGGITTATKAIENCEAGADIIVVGNAIEKENGLISQIAEAIHNF